MSGGVGSAARALAAELRNGTSHTSQWWRAKLDALTIAMGGKPAKHDQCVDHAIHELHYIALVAESEPSAKQLRLLKAASRSITKIVMAARP